MKDHYSRYDLDTVSSITGTPKDDLLKVYQAYSATGVPDKAGTIMYAMGWTPAYGRRAEHPYDVYHPVAARQYGNRGGRRKRTSR